MKDDEDDEDLGDEEEEFDEDDERDVDDCEEDDDEEEEGEWNEENEPEDFQAGLISIQGPRIVSPSSIFDKLLKIKLKITVALFCELINGLRLLFFPPC